jgi:hypothetical protein
MAVTKMPIESGAHQPKNIMTSVVSKSQVRTEVSEELRQIFINSAQFDGIPTIKTTTCSNSTDP